MKKHSKNAAVGGDANAASSGGPLLTGEQVKTKLRERGMTLKSWAKARGYPYQTVSDVVRGINRGTFGMGYRVAVELGIKRG